MASSGAAGGVPAIGAWLNLPSGHVAEMASRAGFDFVCVDMQHGLIDEAAALDMLRAIDAGGATPVVRARWNSPDHLGRMLDFGAEILIVPMIDTARDVEQAVTACRYQPAGRRSYGPTRAGMRTANYLSEAEARARLYPMIETKAALGNLDAIARVTGIEGLFVGPSDLSLGIGLKPGRDNSDSSFVEAIDRVLAACRNNGLSAGIQADATIAEKRIAQGFDFVTVAMDNLALHAAFASAVAAFGRRC